MDINELIAIVKKKLQSQIVTDNILVEDKSCLHKGHSGNQPNKFHLKISIKSDELKKMKKIDSSKKIYKILDEEIKKFIHSVDILILL
jgi:BolA protein